MASQKKGLERYNEEQSNEALLRQLLFTPCETKKDLYNWIKVFLKIDLPDTTVLPESNSNPLQFVWDIYKTAIWPDRVPIDERAIRSIVYSARGCFKSLCATIAEFLIIIHGCRDVVHVGLLDDHAQLAYKKYFLQYFESELIKKYVKKSSILSQSVLLNMYGNLNTLKVIPLTMAKTSGPRAHLLVFDEIDKARGEQLLAYNNAFGMLTTTPKKDMPITFSISTRDTAYGVIQSEIEQAKSKDIKVWHWNIIDITEKCPNTRSGVQKVNIYIRKNTLVYIDETQYRMLPITEQENYEKFEGYDGCLKRCKIFGACLGHLKHQESKCKWLKTIESTQQLLLQVPSEDMAMAQYLCRKPSVDGMVYSDFRPYTHVKTYNQMWEIYTGVKTDREITLEELTARFDEDCVPRYMGADAGFHHPRGLLVFVDDKQNVYVLQELAPERKDSPEFAHDLKVNWHRYGIDMSFPDIESPDLVSALRKNKFPVSKKVDKNVQLGIATIKGFLRVPGSDRTQLFIHESCTELISEMETGYRYRQNPDGSYSDKPVKESDHSCDALRYILHTLFGKERAKLTGSEDHYAKEKELDEREYQEEIAKYNKRALSPEAAMMQYYGYAPPNIDNRGEYFSKAGKKKKKKKLLKLDFLSPYKKSD
jgi:hypothetical protein